MRGNRSSDEHLGFAPRKAVTHEPQPPAEDPGSYVDSWYQVMKAKGEDAVEEQAGETD